MRRTSALVITAAMGLLLAGCGSSTPAPAAANPTGAASSAAAAAPSAPASANLGLATWTSSFCTALTPLGTLAALPALDTSTLPAARTSFLSFFTQYSVALGQIVAGLDTVGPPPGGGSVAVAADALNASKITLRDLITALNATDPADAPALSAVITKAADEVKVLGNALAALDKSLPAEIQTTIVKTPECKFLNS